MTRCIHCHRPSHSPWGAALCSRCAALLAARLPARPEPDHAVGRAHAIPLHRLLHTLRVALFLRPGLDPHAAADWLLQDWSGYCSWQQHQSWLDTAPVLDLAQFLADTCPP